MVSILAKSLEKAERYRDVGSREKEAMLFFRSFSKAYALYCSMARRINRGRVKRVKVLKRQMSPTTPTEKRVSVPSE